jgi:hypothetical protein
MLITKFLHLKIRSNRNYYIDLGYDLSNNGEIDLDINHLQCGSSFIVKAQCDFCSNHKDISYKNYNKNIKNGNKFACSIKCGRIKSSESNLIKYGVEYTTQLDSMKKKTSETLIMKYGVDHPSKIQSVKDSKKIIFEENKQVISDKIKNTWNLKSKEDLNIINDKRVVTVTNKYKVDNISKLDSTKEKVKNTFDEKYGGFTYQSDILKSKCDKTNLSKYGTTNVMSLESIRNLGKSTNLLKYGYEHSSQSDIVKDKVRKTNNEKYGIDNIMHSEEFRISNHKMCQDLNYIKYIGKQISEFKCDLGHDHTYEIDTDNYIKRTNRNCSLCTKCYPISLATSIKENTLYKFISDICDYEIINNYRDKYELDIFIPELNIGFEFNGLYWHSDKYVDNDKHIKKLNYFKNKGIRVIFIWEDDWDTKIDIIKSQIRNILHKTKNRLFARKCHVKEITDVKLVRDFLNSNHIQGFIRSTIKIGLFLGEKLVSIMTFDKFEGRKKMGDYEWNLSRFCNILDTNIIGSASKLLKFFINKYKCNRIISYADKSWSIGTLYYKLGFNLTNESKISYTYLIDHKRVHKQNFKKNILISKGYDKDKSESYIMKELGYNKIYDCGQLKFEMLL